MGLTTVAADIAGATPAKSAYVESTVLERNGKGITPKNVGGCT